MLSKKELELEDLENSQPVPIAKKEKVCSEENSKGVGRSLLQRDCRYVTHEYNQPSWESPRLVVEVCEVYVIEGPHVMRMGIYG